MNKDLAKYLDNANHNATSTRKQIERLCQEVLEFGFNAAFVNSCWVDYAKGLLGDKGKVGTVVSFPLGQDSTEAKINSALAVVNDGADEIDVSANVGWLRAGEDEKYFSELCDIVRAVRNKREDEVIKFIIEAHFLNEEEIKRAAKMVMDAGADFVKTTSGFGPRDAKIEYVKAIKSVVGDRVMIKAAGGISTPEQVREYLSAGANRIGTSKAVEIISK